MSVIDSEVRSTPDGCLESGIKRHGDETPGGLVLRCKVCGTPLPVRSGKGQQKQNCPPGTGPYDNERVPPERRVSCAALFNGKDAVRKGLRRDHHPGRRPGGLGRPDGRAGPHA